MGLPATISCEGSSSNNHDEAKPPGLPFSHPQGPLGDLGSSPLPFSSASSWESGFTLFSRPTPRYPPCVLHGRCSAQARQYMALVLRSLPCPGRGWSLPGSSGSGTMGSVLLELSLPGLTLGTPTGLAESRGYILWPSPGGCRLDLPELPRGFVAREWPCSPHKCPSRPEETAWRELCGTLGSPPDSAAGLHTEDASRPPPAFPVSGPPGLRKPGPLFTAEVCIYCGPLVATSLGRSRKAQCSPRFSRGDVHPREMAGARWARCWHSQQRRH